MYERSMDIFSKESLKVEKLITQSVIGFFFFYALYQKVRETELSTFRFAFQSAFDF